MMTQTKMQLWYPKQVVDARAGPGMKSMTKFKSKNKKLFENAEKNKSRDFEREFSPELSDKSDGNEDADMAEDFLSEEGNSGHSSRTDSPRPSDGEDNGDGVKKGRRLKVAPKRRAPPMDEFEDFIDDNYWKQEQICCGTAYVGLNGEILIDRRCWAPCKARMAIFKARQHSEKPKAENETADIVINKTYSDSSSDSGYDESSNQGMTADSAFKKEQLCIEENNSHISKSN